MKATDMSVLPHQRSKSWNESSTSSSDLSPENHRIFQHSSPVSSFTITSTNPSSPLSWTSAKNQHARKIDRTNIRVLYSRPLIKWFLAILVLVTILSTWHYFSFHHFLPSIPAEWRDDPQIQEILQPAAAEKSKKVKHNPVEWLEKHSEDAYHSPNNKRKNLLSHSRPRAALISLVRNEELEGILQSMRQLEFHWNRNYNYPWIFFNEKPFSDEFKAATTNATSASTFYEIVPKAHWSTPDWIDQERYMNSLDYLGTIGVGKGWMLSYRNMCRWNSGFFYRHPALQNYDYYWRVEPDVHFFCDIPYDPFAFMSANELVYGFNMAILEDARSFPSLWSTTRSFISQHPDLLHPDSFLSWLLDPATGNDYNNCQFFSNFEIGSLSFFRSAANEAYFNWLDQGGGFYYERFGDAPIHTLSVSMFAPRDKVWFFRDIGYQHDQARHCPNDEKGRCACEPTRLDENFYKLVPMESPQRKPRDTCIRLWLGGKWLEKKDGWDTEVEKVVGGDGYGGYVHH